VHLLLAVSLLRTTSHFHSVMMMMMMIVMIFPLFHIFLLNNTVFGVVSINAPLNHQFISSAVSISKCLPTVLCGLKAV